MSFRAAFLLLTPLLFLAACGGPRPRPWGNLVVRPGQAVPLALAASAADTGALTVAAETAAARAGPIDGHPLSFTASPVGCDGVDPSAAAANQVLLEHVAGVVGPMCSAACVYSEGPLYEQRLTMITPACTAAAVVQQGFPIPFRLAWDDNDQAVVAARYARRDLRADRAAVVGDGSVYANSLTNAFKDVFRGAGGSVAVNSSLSPTGGDLRPLAQSILRSRADVVFLASARPNAMQVLAGLRQALPATPIMVSDTVIGAADSACTASGEPRAAASFPASLGDLYVATGLTRRNGAWRSEIDLLAAQGCVEFGQELADAVELYARGISQVAKRQPDGSLVIPRQALRDAIARAKLDGQSGKTTFDPFGERLTDVGTELYHLDHGRLVAVKSLEH